MIYLPKESVIFSGDVLFNGSIGRFDFPNSSKHDTSTSLNKIKEYDFDAIVYPGHGPATSLKQEQASNPYLYEIFSILVIVYDIIIKLKYFKNLLRGKRCIVLKILR